MVGKLRAATAVSAIALCVSAPSLAETTEETAVRFGLMQTVLDIALSPSGSQIAYISPGPKGSEILNVVNLKGDQSVSSILSNTEENADLSYCEWATEQYLVCTVHAIEMDNIVPLMFSRLYSVDARSGKIQILSAKTNVRSVGIRQDGGSVIALEVPGEANKILMDKSFVPEKTIGTRLSNERTGLGVEMVDVTNGRRTKVEDPDPAASSYIADETGAIRMKVRHPLQNTGYLSDRMHFFYRDPGGRDWKPLSTAVVEGGKARGFFPTAIDGKRNVAFGYVSENGYEAVVEQPLSESAQAKTLLAPQGADVDSLIRIGRQQRVVGASYATERRQVVYFDPELASFASKLQQALPGKPLVNIVSANADESKLLIVASSDVDPGMVYLYDKATRELNEILPVRDFMDGQKMGAMQAVSFPAADGTNIPAYLTLPPGSNGKGLRAIVMPHGGPSARDEWGFDWLVQFFVARGYAVLQPNFRGSTGYGADWFGKNGLQAWKTAVGDVDDAGKWLVSQGIADPGKLAIVGWSYGGYAALQSQVLDPNLFKAVVAIAPVTDLEQLRQDSRYYTNYSLVDEMIGNGPHVKAGSPAQHADAFAAPVIMFHGTYDQNVLVGHSQLMERRLKGAGKRVEYVEYPGLDHSLSSSQVRTDMLTKIDHFLAANLGK